MNKISLSHVFYDTSLKHTMFKLGMFYSSREAYNRVCRLVHAHGYSADDVTALEVVSDEKTRYFRVYFNDLTVVETTNDFIMRGKR